MKRAPLTVLGAALLGGLLGGCVPSGKFPYMQLVDRGTFRPASLAPSAEDIARSRLPPLPLVTIRFDQPDLDYGPALAAAVTDAQAHKADIAFDVLTPVPTTGSQPLQDLYTKQGAVDAQAVATALASDGVDPERIHIGLRGDPGAPPREVRVYVR